MTLDSRQLDRACGVLVATAAGDALGAPYEFEPPRGPELPVEMRGGGGFGWEPGEWTDDTAMAIAIAEVAATGADLCSEAAQDAIVARWYEWALTAPDVGNQTRAVLDAAGAASRREGSLGVGARHARAAAEEHHRRTGRSGGNGSLMRTAPIALAYLDDADGVEDGLIRAAAQISGLTHADPEAGEACVLWCLAIRHAVLTGELDLRAGLARLDPERATVWSRRIEEAEAARPADFRRNGWVVQAWQGAWSAIAGSAVPAGDPAGGPAGGPAAEGNAADRVRRALDAAVRGGRDTDTVAAIAGGLVGAACGAAAVPVEWQRLLHGWPGIGIAELTGLATSIAGHGEPDS